MQLLLGYTLSGNRAGKSCGIYGVRLTFVHAIVWHENQSVAYKKVWQESKKYVSEINDNGDFFNEKSVDGWLPIAFGYDTDLICMQIGGKNLRVLDKHY